jgi:hypothetical protein
MIRIAEREYGFADPPEGEPPEVTLRLATMEYVKGDTGRARRRGRHAARRRGKHDSSAERIGEFWAIRRRAPSASC